MRLILISLFFLMAGCQSSVFIFDESFSILNGGVYQNNRLFSGHLKKLELSGAWSDETYIKGKLHGKSLSNYADGKLKSEGQYKKGKAVGIHRGWWPNGNLRLEQEYKNGHLSGEAKEWFANGQLARVNLFLSGRQNGLQQGWREDGKLQFKYTYTNGKRYGFMGASLCMSPYQ